MCLYTHKVPEQTGYKVLLKTTNDLTKETVYYTVHYRSSMSFKSGVWYTDTKTERILDNEGEWYETGFHIYRSLYAARNHVERHKNYFSNLTICLVKYSGVVAEGMQAVAFRAERRYKSVVAKMMKIVKEVE